MLTTCDLGVRLGVGRNARWLFRHLRLAPKPGSVVALVGPNGSGKSTLLRTLAGLRSPSEGQVQWRDRDLQRHDRKTRSRAIAYLPQSTPLHVDFCVEDVVMLGRLPHLDRFGSASTRDRQAVEHALTQVGAEDLRTRHIASLSGGERQRVMLARMLATEAPLLLLDEPTTGLDIGHALGFMELIRQLASKGHSAIAALHDLELARRYADDAVLLYGDDRGRIDAGAAVETLVPAVLGAAFEVNVDLGPQGLSFRPRARESCVPWPK